MIVPLLLNAAIASGRLKVTEQNGIFSLKVAVLGALIPIASASRERLEALARTPANEIEVDLYEFSTPPMAIPAPKAEPVRQRPKLELVR